MKLTVVCAAALAALLSLAACGGGKAPQTTPPEPVATLETDTWSIRATLDDEFLFGAGLRHDIADCVPGYLHPVCTSGVFDVSIWGTPNGTNPTAGSATWTGHALAVRDWTSEGPVLEGQALLEADLSAATIDVHLSDLGGASFSWTELAMADGAFSRTDEEPADDYSSLGVSVSGAFYGPGYEGVAGQFAWGNTIGAFGALRE